jgi:crotonobetainyl-CoA:carnitine CoA-transferase CaiB-like acyl-CoA transferase
MEVVKIEQPGEGDYARWIPPEVGDTGFSHLFHTVNRGKKSVVVDLGSDEGRDAFLELATEADVVFEQFRPGVTDRLGVNYGDVTAVNEDIVYCSLSGYGQDGPYNDRVGHDINYAAIAGLLDKTSSRDSDMPAQPGYPAGDMGGGLVAAFAIITGLLERELGGGGQYLDVSMTDVILSMATGQEWVADRKLDGESIPDDLREPPVDLVHPNHAIYETADGKYVTVAAVEEKFWADLLDELNREDLLEYHYARGEEGEYATAELQAEFAKRTREEGRCAWRRDPLCPGQRVPRGVRTSAGPSPGDGKENVHRRQGYHTTRDPDEVLERYRGDARAWAWSRRAHACRL